MPHSFALAVPNLFARRRESHNRGIYRHMNIWIFEQKQKIGFGLQQDEQINSASYISLPCMIMRAEETNRNCIKNEVVKISFDHSSEVWWVIQPAEQKDQGGWLREADNNRLYGVGHKNWWDRGALKEKLDTKKWRMVLQDLETSPTACPRHRRCDNRLTRKHIWVYLKMRSQCNEKILVRGAEGVWHIDTSLGSIHLWYT